MTTQQSTRRGGWIQTCTGRAFWPLDPRPEEIDIEDIAHALSNLCRFNGHCQSFYSVAQHSVLVSRALPRELRLWGLLHDASEAYLADVPKPLKPFLPGYEDMEDLVMMTIAQRFDLTWPMPEEVKRVDDALLADEFGQLMKTPALPLDLPEDPLGIIISPLPPLQAKAAFMDMFYHLTSHRPAPADRKQNQTDAEIALLIKAVAGLQDRVDEEMESLKRATAALGDQLALTQQRLGVMERDVFDLSAVPQRQNQKGTPC